MSKLIIEIPPIGEKDCYYMQERFKPNFNYPLHKHDALELNFVEHVSGARRIVGDSIEVLGEYDLALIGSNLEHVWEQNDCKSATIHEITIQMPNDLIPESFLGRRVMQSVKELLDASKLGVAFGMKGIMTVYERLNALAKDSEPSFFSVQTLIGVLHDLAQSGDYHPLSSSHYSHVEVPVTSRRVQLIKDYINEHNSEEIRIDVLADLVSMSPNALSRFFKQKTNRSISSYINEVRMGKASHLLAEDSLSIMQISYMCGFNSISNFNRQFKAAKGMTPKEFRDSYKKNSYLL